MHYNNYLDSDRSCLLSLIFAFRFPVSKVCIDLISDGIVSRFNIGATSTIQGAYLLPLLCIFRSSLIDNPVKSGLFGPLFSNNKEKIEITLLEII